MEAKHLAGPWTFSDVRYRWDMVDRRNIYDANGEFVCMVQAPAHEPSARDCLILAAPDLLDALEKSALALDEAATLLRSKGLQGCGSIMESHASIARRAIVKAAASDAPASSIPLADTIEAGVAGQGESR